jgi:3-hydroxymyristoyl/3-hydroxydecanoyl-(acyl carrier protein) dehydratase
MRARMTIPARAPFLADHFPRRPVLPATLLSEAQVRLAIELAARVTNRAPSSLRLRCLRHFKVRAFSGPGQVLVLGARVHEVSDGAVLLAVDAVGDGRTIATARAEVIDAASP